MVNTGNYEIKQLSDVLNPYLPTDTTIVSYTTTALTQPGENYGGLLLAVDIVLKTAKDETEVLHLVAKMCPPNEWVKNMFNIPITFKKEVSMYKTVSVVLNEFLLEYGDEENMDVFARYYGSRISLDPSSNVVDDDAVLLLENLKVKGYSIGNRFEGFDLRTSEQIVKVLANFQAITLALKLKRPNIFNERIKPILQPMKGFSDISDEIKEGVHNALMNILEKSDELAPHLQAIDDYMRRGGKVMEEGTAAREPFATIGHGDFWVNNIMIKSAGDNIAVKIVDFQIADYGSAVRDLIFFLYTSVQRNVIDGHSIELIQLYYDTFIQVLRRFDCDVTPFNFQAFTEELKYEAKESQLFHCLVMLQPIFAVNGAVKEVKDLCPEDMLSTERHEEYEPKVIHTVLSFIKNKWL